MQAGLCVCVCVIRLLGKECPNACLTKINMQLSNMQIISASQVGIIQDSVRHCWDLLEAGA